MPLCSKIIPGVSSLSDEVAYWRRQSKKGSGTSTSERERGEHFAKLLDPAARECARLECAAKANFNRALSGDQYTAQTNIGSGLSELLEMLDPTLVEALDEAWRCLDVSSIKPYPESRMRELLETLGYWVEAVNLTEEIATWRREQFESWSRNNLARLRSTDDADSLAFNPNGQLLTLSSTDGRLKVGFPDGLVQLQREVRLLTGLGYSVPSKLLCAADQAETLYRYAVVLKQVAHFYNSIDSQMIPCQQALMLNSAMAFERLIKSPKAQLRLESGKREDVSITWDQKEEVEWYINQLQNASRQLMTENRRLRKVHFTILEKINRLFEIDLLRYQQRWRNELAEVRYLLAELTNQSGYPADHMAPWRAHLDRQFYKVLETQYCFGLESLSERMPEIRADMIYQQTRLAFKPPFEEAGHHPIF
ncbi:dynein heavy chain 2, cytosolic [Paragonimus westermani]|uniref:Dynein heavy chain 2, cytosolic n=1 Tax=Paragonimus westermani TaxID=34504 RepID=A0A5J4P0D7_9TREM|nr:dynein heavy chain 2, cytosolic [Paragonimus westermani]